MLSPLISKIYFHQLNELMTERGHRIVRFADDFIILCKSQKGADRVNAQCHQISGKEFRGYSQSRENQGGLCMER